MQEGEKELKEKQKQEGVADGQGFLKKIQTDVIFVPEQTPWRTILLSALLFLL